MSKVSIQIVTWNSLKFLPDCLTSIFNQTNKNFSVLVIDNASTDSTIDFLRSHYPAIKILRNHKNLGFTTAHNQGIRLTIRRQPLKDNHYILILNPDIILKDDFLEKILPAIEKNKKIGAIGGKLFKIYTSDEEIQEKTKTKIIDSVGLKIFKNRRVINQGEGEIDKGQYDREKTVFGLSGACVLYRLSALEDIKIPKYTTNSQIYLNSLKHNEQARVGYEYFDEDFFAYKDDIDLAWRLNQRGWQLFYFPLAQAYHFRQIAGREKTNLLEIIKNRKQRSHYLNYLSYRNHLFCLIKNESLINFLKDFPFIFFYELKKFLYLLFFEPRIIKALFDVFKKLPVMLKKRQLIQKIKKISTEDFRKFLLS